MPAAGVGVAAQVSRVIGSAGEGATRGIEAIDEDGREAEVTDRHPRIGGMGHDGVAVCRLLPIVQSSVDELAALVLLRVRRSPQRAIGQDRAHAHRTLRVVRCEQPLATRVEREEARVPPD
eukprot:scaffold39572_cov68-Phaeocystis_antarctica.AAC.7